MTAEFWYLAIGGLLVYGLLFWVDRRWGRELLNKNFNERERAMAASIMKSEQAYVRMESTIDVLTEQIEIKDDQIAAMKASSSERDAKIAELTLEIHRLELVVADLSRQLQEKKVIERPPSPIAGFGIKVLLVAPRSDLPLVDAETEDILRSGLSVTPIYSPIAAVRLTREIRAGSYDGLYLAGHMDEGGNFLLDNGELLSSSALTSLVRGRFRWVYLNTCQSVYAAQNLQNETDADVICTVIDVPDADAYRTGSLFASALARSGDTRAAYEQSRPGNNRIYLYLAGSRKG